MTNKWFRFIAAAVTCGQLGMAQVTVVEGKNIRVEFDGEMHSRVIAMLNGRQHIIGAFTPSETVQLSNTERSRIFRSLRVSANRFGTSWAPDHVR